MSRLALLGLCLVAAGPLYAQSWQGFTIDTPLPAEPPAATPRPGDPKYAFADYCDRRWTDTADGVALRAVNTRGCDGTLATIYISAALSNPDPAPVGYMGFQLGQTRLSEVVETLGSEGLIGLRYGMRVTGELDYQLLYKIEGTTTQLAMTFMATDPTTQDGKLVPREVAWLSSVEMMAADFAALRHQAFPFTPSLGYRAIPNTFE